MPWSRCHCFVNVGLTSTYCANCRSHEATYTKKYEISDRPARLRIERLKWFAMIHAGLSCTSLIGSSESPLNSATDLQQFVLDARLIICPWRRELHPIADDSPTNREICGQSVHELVSSSTGHRTTCALDDSRNALFRATI